MAGDVQGCLLWRHSSTEGSSGSLWKADQHCQALEPAGLVSLTAGSVIQPFAPQFLIWRLEEIILGLWVNSYKLLKQCLGKCFINISCYHHQHLITGLLRTSGGLRSFQILGPFGLGGILSHWISVRTNLCDEFSCCFLLKLAID